MLKKTFVVLLLLLLVFSLAACKGGETKVVTNIPGQVNAPGEAGELNSAEQDTKKKEGTEEFDKNRQEARAAAEKTGIEKQEEKQGAVESSAPKSETKEEAKKQANVVVDEETYKGYKGPVQGEIKYREGTAATANSSEYKATGDIESPYQVNLIVTRDFGNMKMFGKNVGLVKDEVGMEVMFRNLDIKTAYGGGFVNAINGLESKYTFFTGSEREKLDWFYWVNGILSSVGIAEYRPQPGDVIWWDYHNWSTTMFIPAVIGAYPQPFKNGFWGKNPGTVIMYTESFQEGAQKLKESLLYKGVKAVDIAPYDPLVLESPNKYYILLGTWEELSVSSDLLQKMNLKNKLTGVYIQFKDGNLHALNFKGNTVKKHEQAGAIYAYAAGINSLKPLWLVTGTDSGGVEMALNVLLENPSSIMQYFEAVVSKGGVENVPYLN